VSIDSKLKDILTRLEKAGEIISAFLPTMPLDLNNPPPPKTEQEIRAFREACKMEERAMEELHKYYEDKANR